MTGKPTDPFTLKALRKALRAWERSSALGSSPLAELGVVQTARQEAGYGDTPAGHGIALRSVLQAALDSLRPEAGEPLLAEKRWRPYLILHGQYLEGRAPEYLASQLGIARSTYNHEQARALRQVLEQLREWEAEGLPGERAGVYPPSRRLSGEAVPFMAPAKHPQGLVGREELTAQLLSVLTREGPPPQIALHGLPGAGKTSLAAELCHHPEVMARFEEGVLWAGLGPEPEPAVQLHLWEIALGFSAEELMALTRLEDRARALRAAIGPRRLLIVLDDVWAIEPARGLLVGGANCAALFTTRMPSIAHELAGEAVFHVPELDPEPSLQVLGRLVPQLATRLGRRARELVEAVGGLPLALELVGRSLRGEAYAGRPQRLIDALDRLSEPEARLQVAGYRTALESQPGLPEGRAQSLGSAIALSEGALDDESRRAFVALSVFPPKPNTFSEAAARAVAEAPVETLDRLVDVGLVEMGGPDRYRLHRLVADYAASQREGADTWVGLARYAFEFIDDRCRDFLALDAELPNILAGLATADRGASPEDFARAVNAIFPYFEASGLIDQAEQHLSRASKLAEGAGLQALHAEVLVNLGRAAQRRSDGGGAADRFERALALARELGQAELECASLQGLGSVAFTAGDYEVARRQYEQSLQLAQAGGLDARQAALLSNLGTLAATTGDPAAAEVHFREGLAFARTAGEVSLLSALLTNLGVMAAQRGDFETALDSFEESLELSRAAGDRRAMTFLLSNLGALAHDRGDDALAAKHFTEALEMARQIADRARIGHILASLGAVATARGQLAEAEAYLGEGIAIARSFGPSENLVLLLINLSQLEVERRAWAAAGDLLNEAMGLAQEHAHARYEGVIRTRLQELDEKAEGAT